MQPIAQFVYAAGDLGAVTGKAEPDELASVDGVEVKAGRDGDQVCFDSIYHRPVGAVTQPLINWQNRPTFQQVVEIPRSAPR